MKATDRYMHEFMAQPMTQFIIPIYQRNYDWSTIQCQQLLNDIMDAGKGSVSKHFIGFIFYNYASEADATIKKLSVIDGQQRLTTLTLLYIALYKHLKQNKANSQAEQIYELYLANKFDQEPEKLKLRGVGSHGTTLQFLLRDNEGEEPGEYSRLLENFRFISEQVNKSNYKTLLTGLNRLTYIDMFIDRDDNPQRIYESMNSTGLSLSEGDKIRNACLMGLPEEEQYHLYRNYWRPIEELLIIRTKEGMENKMDDFLRDFITIERKSIIRHGDVYQYFRQHLLKGDTKPLLAKLKKYAVYYNKLICPDRERDRDIRKHLEYINRLQMNVSYPFLVRVYDDLAGKAIDKATFIQVLELLQSYIIRRFLTGLNTSLNFTFAGLYESIRDKQDYYHSLASSLLQKKGSAQFPRNEEVRVALKEKNLYKCNAKKREYILERLENHENREPVMLHGNADITVEHIFPQNPDAEWKRLLGEETCQLFAERYLGTIANLTLSGNNGILGNRSFPEKKHLNNDGKQQGYAYSRLWLNRYLASIEKWDLEELDARFSILYERFLLVWQYPAISLPDAEAEADMEVKMMDTRLSHYSRGLKFMYVAGAKIKVKDIHEVYACALKEIFKLHRQVLLRKENAGAFGIAANRQKLESPLPLAGRYHAEGSFSVSLKLEKLKQLLRLVGSENALLVISSATPDQLSLF